MTLNQEQRKIYSSGLMELANISIAALIFGQFLSDKPFNIFLFITGFIVFILAYLLVYILSKALI